MINTIDYVRDMIYGLNTPVVISDNTKTPAINLDNAATTPPFKQVIEAIQQELLYYGSIGRGRGQKSEHCTQVYNAGRETIKKFLGANSDIYTVFYTNNTTDGVNKLASALITSPDDIIITTRMEHHANDLPWRERTGNCKTLYVEVDCFGRLIIAHLIELLEEHEGNVKFVCITAASNVTGYVNDIHLIAKLTHKYGAKIIVDGAQIVAHRAVDMLGHSSINTSYTDESIDFFVFSAHKMYSPFGGGAVVGLKSVLDQHMPQFYGGGMVDAVCDYNTCYTTVPDRYEAGSPNYPSVVGMLKAIEVLQSIGFGYIKRYEQFLMRRTISKLKTIPGIKLYGDGDIEKRVGVIPFNVRDIPPKVVADYLAESHAIAVRHAAFCAHPYVNRLTGDNENDECNCIPPEGMVRVSFGIYTNKDDVDTFLDAVTMI